jgi:hypothetical protein
MHLGRPAMLLFADEHNKNHAIVMRGQQPRLRILRQSNFNFVEAIATTMHARGSGQ